MGKKSGNSTLDTGIQEGFCLMIYSNLLFVLGCEF